MGIKFIQYFIDSFIHSEYTINNRIIELTLYTAYIKMNMY
jgi:hypothetical protein